jgi:hypothetical protein
MKPALPHSKWECSNTASSDAIWNAARKRLSGEVVCRVQSGAVLVFNAIPTALLACVFAQFWNLAERAVLR